MNSVVSFDFAERFVIKNRHFSCSSVWYPIIIYCSSRRMESEWILLRVDNLSLVLHVVVNIRSDLFTMSFSPFPLLHRSSVLSIATSRLFLLLTRAAAAASSVATLNGLPLWIASLNVWLAAIFSSCCCVIVVVVAVEAVWGATGTAAAAEVLPPSLPPSAAFGPSLVPH